MVKLVDAVDSKSTGRIARAGSIPAFGTITLKEKTGEIAKRQYSMILKATCATHPLFYALCADMGHKLKHRDIFKALLTQKKANSEFVEE